jgi:chromosome segregation ATPase
MKITATKTLLLIAVIAISAVQCQDEKVTEAPQWMGVLSKISQGISKMSSSMSKLRGQKEFIQSASDSNTRNGPETNQIENLDNQLEEKGDKMREMIRQYSTMLAKAHKEQSEAAKKLLAIQQATKVARKQLENNMKRQKNIKKQITKAKQRAQQILDKAKNRSQKQREIMATRSKKQVEKLKTMLE